jgi:hypothetical protein
MYSKEPIDQEATQEILRPFDLLKVTARDVFQIFVFWILVATVAMAGLRIFHGVHPEGEEIVVVATPLVLLFVLFRAFRTVNSPLPEEEVRRPSSLGAHRLITISFGLGLLLLLLSVLSSVVYRYLAVNWAVEAALAYAKVLCYALVFLAAMSLCTSADGKRVVRRSLCAIMTYPNMFRRGISHFFSRLGDWGGLHVP